ncbi:hypothetical protein H9P43_009576 [Blastocladiella emersonii ATCC 22665]|nr:hypothetical protein H9P43_009576 [Blastocladiella emersonii ATCC 22665]
MDYQHHLQHGRLLDHAGAPAAAAAPPGAGSASAPPTTRRNRRKQRTTVLFDSLARSVEDLLAASSSSSSAVAGSRGTPRSADSTVRSSRQPPRSRTPSPVRRPAPPAITVNHHHPHHTSSSALASPPLSNHGWRGPASPTRSTASTSTASRHALPPRSTPSPGLGAAHHALASPTTASGVPPYRPESAAAHHHLRRSSLASHASSTGGSRPSFIASSSDGYTESSPTDVERDAAADMLLQTACSLSAANRDAASAELDPTVAHLLAHLATITVALNTSLRQLTAAGCACDAAEVGAPCRCPAVLAAKDSLDLSANQVSVMSAALALLSRLRCMDGGQWRLPVPAPPERFFESDDDEAAVKPDRAASATPRHLAVTTPRSTRANSSSSASGGGGVAWVSPSDVLTSDAGSPETPTPTAPKGNNHRPPSRGGELPSSSSSSSHTLHSRHATAPPSSGLHGQQQHPTASWPRMHSSPAAPQYEDRFTQHQHYQQQQQQYPLYRDQQPSLRRPASSLALGRAYHAGTASATLRRDSSSSHAPAPAPSLPDWRPASVQPGSLGRLGTSRSTSPSRLSAAGATTATAMSPSLDPTWPDGVGGPGSSTMQRDLEAFMAGLSLPSGGPGSRSSVASSVGEPAPAAGNSTMTPAASTPALARTPYRPPAATFGPASGARAAAAMFGGGSPGGPGLRKSASTSILDRFSPFRPAYGSTPSSSSQPPPAPSLRRHQPELLRVDDDEDDW